MIMIAFKGAIGDFLQSPHCAANCLPHVRTLKRPGANRVQITCNTSETNHVQHVCLMVRRDSSTIEFDRVYIALILVYCLAETMNKWRITD